MFNRNTLVVKSIIFGTVALLMAVWAAIQTVYVLKDRSFPLVEGVVFEKKPVEWWRILDREMLMIQVKDSGDIVFARVNNFEEPLDPNHVQFHYSGDPSKEVFLEIEEKPLPILIICFCSAIVLGLFVIFSKRLKMLR